MKLILAIMVGAIVAACTIVATGPPGPTYLAADTDPRATGCGGWVNDVRVPEAPVRNATCEIEATAYVKNGQNTWTACNSAPGLGESCSAAPFTFKLSGKP